MHVVTLDGRLVTAQAAPAPSDAASSAPVVLHEQTPRRPSTADRANNWQFSIDDRE